MPLPILLYTGLALLGFAGNSILCRLALDGGLIDDNSFTVVRLGSGALALAGLIQFSSTDKPPLILAGDWQMPALLFIYAATFSYAYLELDAGVGALILFGFVQITLVIQGLLSGERLSLIKLAGLIVAFIGLSNLLLRNSDVDAAAVSVGGFLLMACAGLAWGGYTILGKHSSKPLLDTGANFMKASVLSLALLPWLLPSATLTTQGLALAILSGAVTSGLGYALWYKVLPYMTRIQAAVLQLTVPVIAVAAGVVLLGEALTQQLVVSMTVTLGGVGLVIFAGRLQK